MKPKQCPRCEQTFADWQPVHLRCFISRTWNFVLAVGLFLISIIGWFSYPLVVESISQAQATPIDQPGSELSVVIQPTASPSPDLSPTPSPTVPPATPTQTPVPSPSPTQTRVSSPSPTQTPVPSPSATSTATIILREDFDNEGNDEEIFSNRNHTIKITNGQLQISVHEERLEPNWLAWYPLDEQNLSEFILEVEAIYTAGQASNQFGLLAFFQNKDNYLAFLISNEGDFSIKKRINGEWEIFHDWTYNSAIKTEPSATNRLKITSKNGEILFEVNDQFLKSVRYNDFDEGLIALVAGTQDEGETTVVFDDLVIYE